MKPDTPLIMRDNITGNVCLCVCVCQLAWTKIKELQKKKKLYWPNSHLRSPGQNIHSVLANHKMIEKKATAKNLKKNYFVHAEDIVMNANPLLFLTKTHHRSLSPGNKLYFFFSLHFRSFLIFSFFFIHCCSVSTFTVMQNWNDWLG